MAKKKLDTSSISDSFDSDTEITSTSDELSSESILENTATIFIKLQEDLTNEIRYIYHLSDIHIRNSNQRQVEYSEVFEKTYKKLRLVIGQNKKISLIVLTGDILHAKTELSPESISMTYHFLKKLSDIATVILIPGNHDTNLSNRHRLDALSPIVNDVGNLPNLHYLKNSGFYLYNNIIFGVTSIFDQILLTANKMTIDMCKSISKCKNKYKIGLYHGAVHSAETDVGFRMNREDLLVEHFKGYDYVLLGDIHKFQYMNEDKTIAYAGSLIQQSYGESVNNHGVLQWDLKSGESKLLEIKNDYGYCTVKIVDGEIESGTIIPSKPRIRFVLENTNEIQYQEIIKKIENEYDLCEIIKESNFRTKLCQNLNTNNKNKKKNTKLAYNTQEDIIRGYLIKKKLDADKIDSIIDLHKKIYQKILAQKQNQSVNIGSVGVSKNQTWKIMELKFSNTLSYGKDNVIDFRNYESNQIIGIMAPNRYGKSAILDIILFCLFDKMSRGERRDILNKNQNKMYCSLLFRIGKVQYLIERIGQRSKNGLSVKIDVNFWEIKTDSKTGIENKEKLNGLDKNDTNKKIVDLIGDYTDYLTTCFCLQSTKTNNFIDMTHLQKKEYLNEILKLNVFEDCHNVAKDKLKELTGQMKILGQKIGTKSFAEIKESITVITKEVQKLTSDQNILQQLITENLDYMLELHEQLPLNNYNDLREYTLESESDISDTIDKLKAELDEMPHIDTQKINSKITNLTTKLDELDVTITSSKCESKLERMRNKLEKLLVEFVNISSTASNIYAKLDIKKLNTEKEIITDRIIQINKMLSTDFSSDLTDKITQISNLKNEILDLKKQIKPVDIQNILYSLDESSLQINPYEKFINTQHDLVDFLTIYDDYYASNNIQIEKTQYQIKIMDQNKKRTQLNISDIEKYISELDENTDISLLEKILQRDKMWIKKYDTWKKRILKLCEENANIISPDKKCSIVKNDMNESVSHIISSTFDTIHHLDNYVINKKIENREKKLSNLAEYSASKKNRDNLKHELENLQQQLSLCEVNITNIDEYNTNIKHNDAIQIQVDEVKNLIKETKVELKQFENERTALKKEIQEQSLLLKNNTVSIARRSKLFAHIKLLVEYQTIFITWNHKCSIYNKYAKLKKKSELDLSEITMSLAQKKIELCTLTKEMDQYLLSRKEFDDKSDETNLYQLYVQSMDYNGLPYEILKDYLPMIGADINQILHSMVNFDIEFMFHDESQLADQKTKQLKSNAGCININLCHKGMRPYNVQLASGFEKFIIGLAIRMTLSQISLTAKPNFLIIDEGWSCLDSEYKNDISAIMSYIKNQYDHVIIISHLEELKSQVDYIINIDRVNNYSYVDTCVNKSIESKKIKSKKSKPTIINI